MSGMKKKSGFNIMLFVFIIISIMNFSCSAKKDKTDASVLITTDSLFSAMSVKDGQFRAFLRYIDEKGVILRDNSYPESGREALRKRYEGKSDTTFTLSWEPVFADISASGELGYTYGLWTYKEKRSGQTERGTYITVWKKQADGSWKFVLDTGTNGLTASRAAAH